MFQVLFPLPPATNPLARWRTIAIYVGVLFFGLSRLPFVLPDVRAQTADLLNWDSSLLLAVNGVFLLLMVLAWAGARRERTLLAATVLIVILMVESALYLLLGSWDSLRGWITLWLVITFGVFLFGNRASLSVVGLALFLMTFASLRDLDGLDRPDQYWRVATYVTLVAGTLTLGALIYHAANRTRYSTPLIATDDVQILIDVSADVARCLSERQELDAFLRQFTKQIVAYFPAIYHAEVYLIKPYSQHATLRASTGTVGQQLIAQEHELEIGGLSAVGRATLTQNELVIQDYHRGIPLKPHPLLPETRAEFTLPLVVNEQVIGAFDVQSTEPDAFPPTDLRLLRAIGNQLAIALDGLQLFEIAQRNIRENRSLYQQTQANLHEIERLNYQLTGRAWSDYLRAQPEATALALNLETGDTSSEAEWTPTLNEAATHHQVITITKAGRRVLALPIIVRNEAVGAMEFEIDSDAPLPDEMFELAQAVGQRLGLALENRRLFDETQRVAQREALINDIGAGLQTATGVDAILQQTARQLQEALLPEQITIRLGKPSDGQTDPERRV
jgi:GAF domain-containing protein